MPLLESRRQAENSSAGATNSPMRRQSQLSDMAKSAIISSASTSPASDDIPLFDAHDFPHQSSTTMGPPKSVPSRSIGNQLHKENKPVPSQQFLNPTNGIGQALTDTPISTAPTSPQMQVPATLMPRTPSSNISQSSSCQQNRNPQDSCNHT